MKRYRFNKLVSLYLDKEISPEELHELNRELEGSESSRRKFKSAILFNQALREKEVFAEEITSVSAIAFARYTKLSIGGFAAALLLAFTVFLTMKPFDYNGVIVEKEDSKIAPIFIETKAPLKKPVQWSEFQQRLASISLDSLKKSSAKDATEISFLGKPDNYVLQQTNEKEALTQVYMPLSYRFN